MTNATSKQMWQDNLGIKSDPKDMSGLIIFPTLFRTIHLVKMKTSFFEWFEVKVYFKPFIFCVSKSEAVINDQNVVLFLGHPIHK